MSEEGIKINLSDLSPGERYHLLVQSIVPRPIAWVMSDNGISGENQPNQYNFAPFSFFNAVSGTPPMVVLGFSVKSDGSHKDSFINLKERKKCTIHIASSDMGQNVFDTSAELPFGETELTEEMRKHLVHEYKGFPPRYAPCKIALFAELNHIHTWEGSSSSLAICEIKHTFIDKSVAEQTNDRLVINQESLKALARLGGSSYTYVDKVLKAKRPTPKK